MSAYADARPMPGPSGDALLPLLGVVAGTLVAVALLLVAGPAQAIAVVAFLGALGYAVSQPRAGFYLVAFLAIAGTGSMPFADQVRLGDTYPAYGLYLTPLEMLVAASTLGLAIRLVFDDRMTLRVGSLFLPIAALMLTVFLGIAVGIHRGADFSVMRSETRGFFYLPALSLLATHVLRSRADLRRFTSMLVLAINIMAAFSIYHYYAEVRATVGSQDLAFPHEDSLFCAAGVIIVLARIVWTRSGLGELKSATLLVLPTFALLVMRRRAGMVALDAGLLLLCVVLVRDNFRLFLIAVPIAVLGAGLLLAMTWNDPGGLGQPARAFRAATGGDQQLSARDQSSDDYRAVEAVNIRLNIQNQPLTGLGFGRPYAFFAPVPDLSFWPLWRFVPHDSVFWVWMKAGALAFIALLALFAAAMMRSVQLMTALRSDSLKPLGFALAAIVLMFVLFSYVDLGMVTLRAMLFFGLVLGAIGALGTVTQPSRAAHDQSRARQ